MNGCTATSHGTAYARRRRGCECPEAIAARRAEQKGRPIPGRGHGCRIEREIVAERIERTTQLTRAGRSAAEIAITLGVAQRSVVRYRARSREQAA